MVTTVDTVTIFVRLISGSEGMRQVRALNLGDGLYKILPSTDYHPEKEQWEFPPHSVVRCSWKTGENGAQRIASRAD
jgi:hypothetical protein